MTDGFVATALGRSGGPGSGPDAWMGHRDIARDGDRLAGAIEVVLRIVEDETAAIRAFGVKEVEKFTERKGQALMALTRLLGAVPGVTAHPSTVSSLQALRAALEANQVILKVHIDAVTEVSQVIVRCVQNSTSDGTYSKAQLPYGQY